MISDSLCRREREKNGSGAGDEFSPFYNNVLVVLLLLSSFCCYTECINLYCNNFVKNDKKNWLEKINLSLCILQSMSRTVHWKLLQSELLYLEHPPLQ
jgi:hypothetical protein